VLFSGKTHRLGDGIVVSRQSGEMIVLDENAVVQADTMIVPAALADGVFLQQPPTGRGFPRVEDLSGEAGDGIEVATSLGSAAGRPARTPAWRATRIAAPIRSAGIRI
jgi:hypothetical protein